MDSSARSCLGLQPLIACEHCASVYRRRVLLRGELASCTRCGTTLWRYSRLSLAEWFAIALTGLVVFCVANAWPVARFEVYGAEREATLLDAVRLTWQQRHWAVSVMTGLAGFAMPLMQLLTLLWVLAPLALGRMPESGPGFGRWPWLSRLSRLLRLSHMTHKLHVPRLSRRSSLAGMSQACRLLRCLRPWSMAPVFLLGAIVSLVKLAGVAQIHVGLGLFALGALAILLTMLGRLTPQVLWRYAEDAGLVQAREPQPRAGYGLTGCPACGQVQNTPDDAHPDDAHSEGRQWRRCLRCHAALHRRKPHALARTWALLLAAAILYVPANVLPVMRIATVMGDSQHTILGGVVELWDGGAWDIALIVFVASVVVPLTKLLSLALLTLRAQRGDTAGLRARTRLYEFVEFIGQWSMLDVFVVILLSALADFPGLMTISADAGATAFGLVVILTMLAAMSFDPRRAWDQADRDSPKPVDRDNQKPIDQNGQKSAST